MQSKMPMSQSDLLHYGVLGMTWGVRRYQPYPSGSKKGKEIGEAAKAKRSSGLQKTYDKSSKKLASYKEKIDKKQEKANRLYQKAVKKNASRFSSEKSIQKVTEKATKAQRSVNRLEYKASNWYKTMEKTFGKINVSIDSETKKIGQDYIERMTRNSESLFNQSMYNYKRVG